MQLREALRSALASLQECNVPSPGLAAELLLMHVLGRDRAFLYAYPEFDLDPAAAGRYFDLIAERATGKPTQYITGHQEFWGLDFEVTPDVLIPRPETEHLVEAVLGLASRPSLFLPTAGGCVLELDNPHPALRATLSRRERVPLVKNSRPSPSGRGWREAPGDGLPTISRDRILAECENQVLSGIAPEAEYGASPRIVDVGTGSGCIALALASELPRALIVGTDVSRPALEVARRNARRLGLADRVDFVETDLLNCFTAKDDARAFDFVVSNPPYISLDEMGSVQREVRDFEPRIALGGTGSGAEIYGRLFSGALAVLRPGGYVAVEIGYNQSDAVLRLLGEGWDDAEVRPDLAGIPRVVVARKQPSAVSLQQRSKQTRARWKG